MSKHSTRGAVGVATFHRYRHFSDRCRERRTRWLHRRRYKQRSALGAILDPIADKGLLLSGIITSEHQQLERGRSEYGRFPAWFPVSGDNAGPVILVGSGILHYFIGNKMRKKPSWTGK